MITNQVEVNGKQVVTRHNAYEIRIEIDNVWVGQYSIYNGGTIPLKEFDEWLDKLTTDDDALFDAQVKTWELR